MSPIFERLSRSVFLELRGLDYTCLYVWEQKKFLIICQAKIFFHRNFNFFCLWSLVKFAWQLHITNEALNDQVHDSYTAFLDIRLFLIIHIIEINTFQNSLVFFDFWFYTIVVMSFRTIHVDNLHLHLLLHHQHPTLIF